jgi:hypothetical protein
VRVVSGELTDYDVLNTAMKSVTPVVSFLGTYMNLSAAATRNTNTPIAHSFTMTLRAMNKMA